MPKLNLTRRWIRSRPGSVLILVIALLVLLALIGTAYLSSTQTERYTSVQNSINTEADLLISGLQIAADSQIAGGLYGSSSSGEAYRPPQGEMPTYTGVTATVPTLSTYHDYDSIAINNPVSPNPIVDFNPPDMFLAARIPTEPASTGVPTWSTISWPLFSGSSGYTADSPFGSSLQLGVAIQKGNLLCVPTSTTANGTTYPAMNFFVPTGQTFTPPSGPPITGPGYISATPVVAADADGDGIADSILFKLPVGPIDGITYYGACRIVDGNSAINVSSANSQGNDTPFNATKNPATNFGMFRSNIGLSELLVTATDLSTLNSIRVPSGWATTTADLQWYSLGDEMDALLTRTPGNPGTGFSWIGETATATLAYKNCLLGPSAVGSPAPVEAALPSELLYSSTGYYPSSAYSPAQTAQWWSANYSSFISPFSGTNTSPLRTLLVGNNAVSNSVPAWPANTSNSLPPAWTSAAGTVYKFGDWVVDGPSGKQRSFVCIQQHTPSLANEPENGTTTDPGYNPSAVSLWAGAQAAAPTVTGAPPPGMPYTTVQSRTSVNTATFEQLWVAFAQVMTDSIGLDPGTAVSGALPQWQPPMQPTYQAEPQMPQFRSILRTPLAAGSAGRPQLTSSQMLKLRAALAAVNAIDLRGGPNTVTSKHIFLPDASGAAQYEVEIYGNKPQPYISEMVAQVDTPANVAKEYVAIELVNPYPVALVLTNWTFATMDRSTFGTAGGMQLTPLPMDPTTPTITIPAATSTTPGIAVVVSNIAPPTGVVVGGSSTFLCPNLYTAIGKELVFLRPRLYDGVTNALSTSSDVNNTYAENPTTPAGCADMVPVDQLDLTGADGIATLPARLQYRRGSAIPTAAVPPSPPNPAVPAGPGYAWNFIYPGPYNPGAVTGTMRMSGVLIETGAAMTGGNLGVPDAGPPQTSPATTATTFNTAPIQLSNTYMAGPNPMDYTNRLAMKTFPFGHFARNLDMLQIPFIGAYRIRASGMAAGSFTEMNAITMDSTLANDTTIVAPNAAVPTLAAGQTTYPLCNYEQIGRFCPVGDPSSTTPSAMMDFGPGYDPTDSPQIAKYWHYHWAEKLLKYLTVNSPQDDYYPNVDPLNYPDAAVPTPVGNSNNVTLNAVTAGKSEDTVGVEGLININTAPAPVLAQLPFTATDAVDYATPAAQKAQNAVIGQAIADDRTANGPFKSIFDLYRVKAFRDQNTNLLATDPGLQQGDFSPSGLDLTQLSASTTDNVRFDFKERFLLLNNISNLITTRSDTFTVYLLLQGWRNVGTGNPTLVVQRRKAFLVDRNGVTPSNNQVSTFPVASQ